MGNIMDNVQNIKDYSPEALIRNFQKAIEHAINVPQPNENTDSHLALVNVGDLKAAISFIDPGGKFFQRIS